MRVVTLCAALVLAFCVASAASVQQNQDQPSSQDQAAKKKKKSDKEASGANASGANSGAAPAAKPAGDKPQPLFGGSLNLKSSRQSKDTATLGFNGRRRARDRWRTPGASASPPGISATAAPASA